MAVFDPDLKDLRREQRLRNTEAWQSERLFASWAIRELRTARTAGDLYRWHKALVERFADAQDEATRARREARDYRRRHRPVAKPRELQDRRYAAKARLGLYRCLGDALVWRLLRCRRAEITAIGHG